MKYCTPLILLGSSLLLGAQNSVLNAQVFFQADESLNQLSPTTKADIPTRYELLVLSDVEELEEILQEAPTREHASAGLIRRPRLTIPLVEGRTITFDWMTTPVLAPELAAKYPHIQAYTGVGRDVVGATAKLDIGDHGVHVMIRVPGEGMYFVAPYRVQDNVYMTYALSDLKRSPIQCLVESAGEFIEHKGHDHRINLLVGDCELRRYRLAVAGTGEYTTFHGGTVSGGLSAITTTVNVVNGVYEADISVTLQLVSNNDQLVYTNPATDPYTNNSTSAMLSENQANCDTVIGSANYDIGHVFGTPGGGVASIRSPCSSTRKAQGVSGRPSPVGPTFDIDYVAHEMGHQFGANHTQNNNCNRVGNAAYEPGSASTIMGYAGICPPNVQSNSDPYLHGHSLDEMGAFITNPSTGASCPVVVSSAGDAPVVSPLLDRTLPISTPFELVASASDPGGDPLTYCWEHWDNGIAPMPPSPTSTTGPSFRSLLPLTSATRTFPDGVVGNTWEVLPSVSRVTDFRVTVRDLDTTEGYGCTDEEFMTATFDASGGPLVVTVPNGGELFFSDSTYTVTWSVAGTDAAIFNGANVDILLSLDGGATYPTTLLSATPNDGIQDVVMPSSLSTTMARLRIQASANVFFDISDGDFTITDPSNIPDTTCRTFSVNVGLPISYPDTTSGMFMITDSGTVYSMVIHQVLGTHTWVEDMDMFLQSPSGTQIELLSDECGNSVDFDVAFIDGGSTYVSCPMTSGQLINPTQPLSTMVGEESLGEWRVRIADDFSIDDGVFTSFRMTICASWSDCDPIVQYSSGTVPLGMHHASQKIDVEVPFNIGQTELTAPEINLLPNAEAPTGAELLLMPGGCP